MGPPVGGGERGGVRGLSESERDTSVCRWGSGAVHR